MAVVEPPWLDWMLELLELSPRHRVLEIGCGGGLAADRVCRRLRGGRLVALDRSPRQAALAAGRNAAWVAAGRATFLTVSLEEADLAEDGFDRAYAANVNVFWTDPAPALDALARLLAPGGRLVLVFRPPAAAQAASIAERCVRALEDAGFRAAESSLRTFAGTRVAAVTAGAPGRAAAGRAPGRRGR